jgi:hypothetical protein
MALRRWAYSGVMVSVGAMLGVNRGGAVRQQVELTQRPGPAVLTVVSVFTVRSGDLRGDLPHLQGCAHLGYRERIKEVSSGSV